MAKGAKFTHVNRSHVAKELGLNRGHVVRVMQGKAEPGLLAAAGIARLMGISLDEFAEQWRDVKRGRVRVAVN